MKKLIAFVLAAALAVSAVSCNKKPSGAVVQGNSDTLYKSCLTLLTAQNGLVTAACPLSRDTLNGRVEVTSELLSQISQAMSKYEPKPSSAARVPGNSGELELHFGEGSTLSVYIYNIEADKSSLIWLQNSEQRLQLSAPAELYSEINALLSGAVVSAQPTYDGDFIEAQLLSGRDISRGFYESGGILAAAFSSYDANGWLDFYNIETGELIKSLAFDKPLYRLDTGKNGLPRVFSGGKLYYIDIKKQEIKSEFEMPKISFDNGDSFDVDEKLKIIAYADAGVIYICNFKGETSLPVMQAVDLQRTLTTEVLAMLEADEALVSYKNPRIADGVLMATAASSLSARPLLGISSFTLNENIEKQLADEEFVSGFSPELSVVHFPGVFGSMGSLLGVSGSTVITGADNGFTFSKIKTGDSWQLPYTWGTSVLALENGIVCTLSQELAQNGVRYRVDISNIDEYSTKTQVFAATATPVSVLGGTKETLIIKEGTFPRLLLIRLKPFLEE